MMQRIEVKIINEKCQPEMGQTGDAAFDLKANGNFRINPGQKAIIPLGVAFNLPPYWKVIASHRSSMAFKKDCIMSFGIIDENFKGEVKAAIFNLGEKPVRIEEGDRIAQVMFERVEKVYLAQAWFDDDGKEGFGSSGGYANDSL